MVSEVAGTTRDIIELRIDLRGLAVTLLDTAGLRDVQDHVESLGIVRARERASAADLRVHLSPTGEIDTILWQDGDLAVASKSDLNATRKGLSVSALTGQGLDLLLTQIFETLSDRTSNAALVSHHRQVTALMEAVTALTGVDDLPPEFLAENIRQSAVSLDRLLGRIGAEDYLDVIFTSFCIGK